MLAKAAPPDGRTRPSQAVRDEVADWTTHPPRGSIPAAAYRTAAALPERHGVDRWPLAEASGARWQLEDRALVDGLTANGYTPQDVLSPG